MAEVVAAEAQIRNEITASASMSMASTDPEEQLSPTEFTLEKEDGTWRRWMMMVRLCSEVEREAARAVLMRSSQDSEDAKSRAAGQVDEAKGDMETTEERETEEGGKAGEEHEESSAVQAETFFPEVLNSQGADREGNETGSLTRDVVVKQYPTVVSPTTTPPSPGANTAGCTEGSFSSDGEACVSAPEAGGHPSVLARHPYPIRGSSSKNAWAPVERCTSPLRMQLRSFLSNKELSGLCSRDAGCDKETMVGAATSHEEHQQVYGNQATNQDSPKIAGAASAANAGHACSPDLDSAGSSSKSPSVHHPMLDGIRPHDAHLDLSSRDSSTLMVEDLYVLHTIEKQVEALNREKGATQEQLKELMEENKHRDQDFDSSVPRESLQSESSEGIIYARVPPDSADQGQRQGGLTTSEIAPRTPKIKHDESCQQTIAPHELAKLWSNTGIPISSDSMLLC
jgi:hypothetical protein